MKKIIIIIGILLVIGLGIFFFVKYNTKEDKPIEDTNYYVEIDYQEFKKLVDDKKTFALVIHRTGCPHCETYLPVIESIANGNELTIYGVNTSNLNETDLVAFNNMVHISGTPSTIFYFDGVEKSTINRLVGDLKSKTVIDRFKSLGFIGE